MEKMAETTETAMFSLRGLPVDLSIDWRTDVELEPHRLKFVEEVVEQATGSSTSLYKLVDPAGVFAGSVVLSQGGSETTIEWSVHTVDGRSRRVEGLEMAFYLPRVVPMSLVGLYEGTGKNGWIRRVFGDTVQLDFGEFGLAVSSVRAARNDDLALLWKDLAVRFLEEWTAYPGTIISWTASSECFAYRLNGMLLLEITVSIAFRLSIGISPGAM